MTTLIDCGYYAGIATKKYIDQVDKVYAFEPNPKIKADRRLIRKAVWIEDGEMDFIIVGRNDAHHLDGTSGVHEEKRIKVKTIDFSRFVKKLPDTDIICSMDIEGAEYKVLEKMIEDNTIDKIKILDIEFHHRLCGDYTKEDSQRLIDEIKKRGVEVILKVPL